MGNHRILIVDDNQALLKLLGITIGRICPDCQLIMSSDSLAALEQVKKRSGPLVFDLIFTDYDMPAMNGLELARAVYNIDSRTKVVLMTGHSFVPGLNGDGRPLNLAGLLRKPFRKEEFEQTFKAVLSNSLTGV
jgi:two-component SAPR family response regulator